MENNMKQWEEIFKALQQIETKGDSTMLLSDIMRVIAQMIQSEKQKEQKNKKNTEKK